MSPLNRKSLAECKTQELYCSWKGQLLIQEKQLCNIILRSPFATSIPAQLPARLDIKHVVAVSELRKKFPEAVFRRNSYTDHEVISEEMLFHLYEVEVLNHDGPKVEQLIEHLKEKDVALVKYLNCQRVLFLLASTALVKEKDSIPEEAVHLQALFLISAPGPKCLTANDARRKHGKNEPPAQVGLVLPILRQALLEAAKDEDRGRGPLNALVRRHIQALARLPKTLPSASEAPDPLPLSFELDPDARSEKCPQSSYGHLQFYLSHPQHYTLETSAALACLDAPSPSPPRDGGPVADDSSGFALDPLPPEIPTDGARASLRPRCATAKSACSEAALKASLAGDPLLQRCKRRSSRLLGASATKKWSPLKVLSLMENSKKPDQNVAKNKPVSPLSLKRSLSAPPLGNSSGRTADFSEPTLKLKNLQSPLRRKRGAQVLSAEFVRETRTESAPRAPFSSDSPDPSEKKPRLLRCRKDGEKLQSTEQADIRRPVTRSSTLQSARETLSARPAEAGDENKPWAVGTAAPDVGSALNREECDSHALNMLADLALSCNSPLMTNGSQSPPVAASPSQEHGGMSQGKISGKPLDHEYHRGRQNWRGGSLTDSGGRASLSPPGPCGFGRARPSTSEERDPLRSRGTRNPRPASLKTPAVSPKETGELADPSVHALISSEHSYASLASDPFKRGAASALDPRNGVEHATAEPLLLPGKVLPFRHQQHLCPPHKLLKSYVPFPRSTVMAKRLKDDVSKFRQVTFCDRTVKVTFQWEAEYLFSLDSKYTSHPLEKTIVRAVHGPWDVGLPNSVEEMKLIIHMWVALFYSKPFKSPLARTVVEHSNPAKYVSLNSTLDSFEFADDLEGPCGLEKGPPGSLSDTPRSSREVTERAASPSEMPLSCDEPSSTNCIANEPTLAGSEEPSDRPWEEDQFTAAACSSKDDSPSVGKEADQEPEGELLPSASAESPNRYPSLEQSDGHGRPQTPRADVEAEAEAKRVVNLAEAEASQSEAVPITAKLPVGEQLVAATEAAPLEMDRERNSDPLPPDEENGNPSSAGAEALPTSAVEWIEADAASQAEDMREPQDLPRDEEDTSEESTTWESIDLALSESNDTDVEPQDMDLGQEDEEPLEDTVTEEREEDTASPNDGLLTSAASQPELPGTRKVSALPASTSASLSPMALVEGSCLLPEDGGGGGGGGSPVGSVSQQADLTHHDTEAESADVEGTENSVSPSQTVVDEDFIISEEDAAASLMASTPKRPEELHVQDDAELVKSQESSVSVRNQSHPSPMDLADLTHVAREEKDRHCPDSVKGPASPFGCKAVSDGTDLPENQGTFAETTERHVPPNQLDLIEDISQDGTEGAGVDTLQNRVPCQVQSESTGNGEDVSVSSPNLALADFIPGPSVLQEKGEVPLADPVELPGTPVHQTSEGIKEPLRNQEESTMAAEDAALPDQVDFDGEFCLPQEKEGSHLPEAAPLGVGDSLQMQHTPLVQEEQGSRPTELMNSSSDGEASQCVEKEGREFESGSENRRCVENENVRASSLEVVPGGKRDQVVRTEPEGAGSRDTVSGMNAESDGTWNKENSTVTWMSSVNLENITPPESDEDTPASSRLPHVNTKWVVSEYLQQCHVVADHERAPSEARAASLSTLHKTAKYNQREIERKTLPESEATSTIVEVVPGSLRALWVDVGRSGRKHTVPSVKSCVPSEDTALDKSATSELCGVDMEQASHVASEKEERIREMSPQILSTEGHREYSSEEVETLLPGDARETLGDPEDARSSSASMAVNWKTGSSFVGNGHDVVGDAYPSTSGGFSCPPGEVDVTNRVCDLSLHKETSQSGDRGYPEEKERMLDAGTEPTKHNDRPVTPSLDNRHHPGRFHDYVNFSVTKKHKEKTRTFHSSMQHECCARAMGPVHSWNKAVGMGNDPTQNTLDTACLRFHCKVKQILKKSQRSTSTATFMKKFPRHVMTKPSSSRAVPGAPALSPPPRCHSPLLITVRNPGPRLTASPHYLRNSRHVDSFEPPLLPPLPPFVPTQEPLSKAARCANQGPGPITSFHLNKLTYSNKLKDVRGDISVIMDEFAELSRVITLDGRPRSPQGRDPRATSEEAVEERGPALPRRTPAYEHLFAELCNTLHFRLKSVAQEACKKPYAFYLMETDNDPCFGRLKNLLKKGGHAEMEPLQFCNTSHVETDRMMVIIRNEDIFLHIHKIPCLLRLKHFPSVTFAGVDSPEDVVDCTYQELFHRGGFVVSDDHTLEAMSVGELKEMLKTLEKLQGHGQWRWLLHYKEVKQLREKARVDPAAHTKESLLKSCQGANLTEVLHYHQCDSRASPKSERLSCVLNLQVQRISERFAVFLTDKPSSSQEALEGKGILVFDVPTFLEKAEDLASLCRSSC